MNTYEEFEHQCLYCGFSLFRSYLNSNIEFVIDIDSLSASIRVTAKGQQFLQCPNCKLKNLIRSPYNENGKLIAKLADY
jgi:hypothetical protein